jgi:3-hydroxyisobutyrate dehydrogenase
VSAIAVIGLGHVGLAVSRRLIDAGRRVTGYRRSGTEAFVALGGTAARSAIEVVERCDTVLLALPGADPDADVLDAIFDTAPAA